MSTFPGLTDSCLFREFRERGFGGGYTAVTNLLREIRPAMPSSSEVRFDTAPNAQAQIDCAQFQVFFTDEPSAPRVVGLFSLALGYSRSL
jgi:transposase